MFLSPLEIRDTHILKNPNPILSRLYSEPWATKVLSLDYYLDFIALTISVEAEYISSIHITGTHFP